MDKPKKKIFNMGVQDVLIIVLDILAVNGGYYLALYARYYGIDEFRYIFFSYLLAFWQFFPFYTVISITIFHLLGLYKGTWKYAGLNDLNRILAATAVTFTIQVLGTSLFIKVMPLTYYIVGALFQFFFVCVVRMGYRVYLMEKAKLIRHISPKENLMLIGKGKNAKAMMEYLEHDQSSRFKVVCIIDDKDGISGKMQDGVPIIGGTDKLEEGIEKYKVRNIATVYPIIDHDFKEQLESVCKERFLNCTDYSGYLDYLNNDTGLLEIVKAPVTLKMDGAVKHVIPFSPPDIGDKEIGEVVETLKSGWITTGPRTKLLERRLAAYIETGKTDADTEKDTDRWKERVVCLNSATAAEELNLRVLGIGPGDEVIIPAYTYTASASAAVHCGAKVVFVDIQKDGDRITHCPEMDYRKLEEAITPATKAIIPVDIAGIVCDYDRIFEIVERKRHLFKPLESDGTPLNDLASRIQKSLGRVAVVCDAAHALGASRIVGGQRKYVGAIADFTSFSFHAVKNFTTAEGGASAWRTLRGVENAEIYKMYQLLSLHGQNKDALAKTKSGAWEYDIIGPWYKCNMTDIMAAIGLGQLDRYAGLLEKRVEVVKKYDAVCDELGISHMHHHVNGMDSSNHLYMIRIPGAGEIERNKIIEKMAEKGVATNVHYKPLPMMTAYGRDCSQYPNTYDYYHNLLTLPLHTLLTDEDVDFICKTLKEIVGEVMGVMAA